MINAHWNQRIDNVESSLSQKLDELQNDMFHKLNNLEDSISRLTNQQHVHSEEENPEEVYLSDTMVEEHCTLLTEEGNGKEALKEPKKHVLKPFPTNNPLPVAPSTDQVYILPTPEAYPTPETPSPKATPFALPWLHNLRKLAAITQTFSLHRRRWQRLTLHGIVDGSGAGSNLKHLNLGIATLHQFPQPPKG